MGEKSNKYQHDHCVLDSTWNQMNEGKGIASQNPVLLREEDIEGSTKRETEGPGKGLWLALRTVFMQVTD